MNLNSVAKNGQHETADYSKKRKQNEFSVEVQERAEVCNQYSDNADKESCSIVIFFIIIIIINKIQPVV